AAGRRLEAVATLHVVPAVVDARRVARAVVDLFPAALADVADVDVAVRAVEAEAEGVTQTLGPVGGRARGRVDAQELAEHHRVVLRVLRRISAAAAVSGAGVEKPVRTEVQVATVVVGEAGVWD